MARLTYTRARKPLVEENEIWRSASGGGTGEWTEFAITIRNVDGEGSYRLKFNRAEAESIATYFREMLDQKIDSYGMVIKP